MLLGSTPVGEGKEAGLDRGSSLTVVQSQEALAEPRGSSEAGMAVLSCSELE